eukprot:6623089-Prymnesium_polylepis.1
MPTAAVGIQVAGVRRCWRCKEWRRLPWSIWPLHPGWQQWWRWRRWRRQPDPDSHVPVVGDAGRRRGPRPPLILCVGLKRAQVILATLKEGRRATQAGIQTPEPAHTVAIVRVLRPADREAASDHAAVAPKLQRRWRADKKGGCVRWILRWELPGESVHHAHRDVRGSRRRRRQLRLRRQAGWRWQERRQRGGRQRNWRNKRDENSRRRVRREGRGRGRRLNDDPGLDVPVIHDALRAYRERLADVQAVGFERTQLPHADNFQQRHSLQAAAEPLHRVHPAAVCGLRPAHCPAL